MDILRPILSIYFSFKYN